MTDQAIPIAVDLSKYVERRLFGDRPHIRGRRIPVMLIARRMSANGWTIAETAYDFGLTEAEVLAALLYCREHEDELARQEAAEAALFDEMARRHDSR